LHGETIAVIRKYRTALVGVGRIGATYAEDPLTRRYYQYASHAEVLAKHPAFAWEAAVDTDAAALAHAQARWGFAHDVATMSELRARYEPEVLVLATPPSAYYGIIEDCPGLRAVLCEKPLGNTLADARALLELCESRGILLQVNFWRRGDAYFRQLAAGGLATLVGKPQVINGVYGNGLLNNGSHLVDFCRMLFGEIGGVRAPGPAWRRGALVLDGDFDAACTLRFANGTEADLRPLDFRHYREVGLDIWGETGRLEILNEGLTCRLARRQPHRALSGAHEVRIDAPERVPSTVGDALFQVYENLSSALNGRAELFSAGVSAWRTAFVVDAIRHATLAGDDRMQTLTYGERVK
jgi:predicted dehydrogenase